MTVTSAKFTSETEKSVIIMIDGQSWEITEASRFWSDLWDWVDKGNTISPYDPPPEPEKPRDLAAEIDALKADLIDKGVGSIANVSVEMVKP